MDITNDQWKYLAGIFPEEKGKRGRPKRDLRSIVNGIFWLCRTGSPWAEIPKKFAPYSTCHRIYKELVQTGLWDQVLWKMALYLKEHEGVDITSLFKNQKFDLNADRKILFSILSNEISKGSKSSRFNILMIFINPFPSQVQSD